MREAGLTIGLRQKPKKNEIDYSAEVCFFEYLMITFITDTI